MANLGPNFYTKLVQISSELGMKPEDLLAVMVSESGINPAAHEKKYNGGGLLGFMPDTMKNLGFKGSPDDFRKLSGQDQLDYVKKLVQGNMGFNGGRPFKSAAQYYMANFVPAALGLPGIKAEDPKYAFLEKYPTAIKDPKTGELFSKKYYDIGVKLSVKKERLFYDANPLFHDTTPNAITYGDILKRVEMNKKSPSYTQALAAMKAQTGYVATSQPSQETRQVAKQTFKAKSKIDEFLNGFTNLLQQFSFASAQNTFKVAIASNNYSASLEYANILSMALDEYLKVNSSISEDSGSISLAFNFQSDPKDLIDAVRQLSESISEEFEKISNNKIYCKVLLGCENSKIINPKISELHHNKFVKHIKG